MIARRKPIKRGKPPKRSGRIKPKKRSVGEFARIYGSQARVRWIKAQPCYACGAVAGGDLAIVNAHTENGGTGRKAEYTTIIPLCTTIQKNGCHDWQHQYGWQMLLLDNIDKRRAVAAKYEAAWLASLPPLEASPKC